MYALCIIIIAVIMMSRVCPLLNNCIVMDLTHVFMHPPSVIEYVRHAVSSPIITVASPCLYTECITLASICIFHERQYAM